MSRIADHLFVLLQKIIPKHLLTAIVYQLARIKTEFAKNFLIRQFVRLFSVDLTHVNQSVPDGFADFNAFFTRELADGARPVDERKNCIISPVDGTVSATGAVNAGTIFQAKGLNYSLDDLLATDLDTAAKFHNGAFATIYLAPYDYHRIHCPVDGTLVAANYLPGDLFSVNDATVSLLPNLFTRNERLVCHFETAIGPVALVMVGALNVGSISTPWSGTIRPRMSGVARTIDLQESGVSTRLEKGDLLGWFNMGSTVILLLPPGTSKWPNHIASGQKVRMGEAITRNPADRT